jgi:Chaperone of endosialidase
MYQLTALQTATLRLTNSIHRSPLLRGLLFIPLLLACFALLPRMQAAPDPAAIPGGNTRDGAGSLASRTTGINNSAFGTNALNKLTIGNNNAAQGNSAQFSLIDGDKNTALGVLALRLNIHGNDNVAVGYKALYNDTTNENVAVGSQALYSNTDGINNTGLGFQALFSNSGADGNTAVGFQALASNTASNNTAMGASALSLSQAGGNNTAIGFNALGSEVTGISNVAVGSGALANAIHGFNIAVGADAGSSVTTAIGVIAIGSSGANVGGSCFIGNIRGVMTANANAQTVVIDSSGQLGTISSSRRFKKDIKPMDQASEAILRLKPVTFDYKSDSTGTPQFGLIAEEVAEINPDLIVRDADGEIYGVRYEAVNAMLLNEFLKEHQKVEEQRCKAQEQEAAIVQLKQDLQSKFAEQQKQIKALTTGLEKVNNQLELSKPATAVVVNE